MEKKLFLHLALVVGVALLLRALMTSHKEYGLVALVNSTEIEMLDDGGGVPFYDSESRDLASSAFQPTVTKVEREGPTRTFGSLSMPAGSPWCGGKPTYWLVGHEKGEHPWCKETNGSWTSDRRAELDITDPKNMLRLSGISMNPANIDRHDCVHLDVNKDSIPDIVCVVGAGKNKALGFSELYLTKPDGTLKKVDSHGLQVRTRYGAREKRFSTCSY